MMPGAKVDYKACLHVICNLLACPAKHRHKADLLANMREWRCFRIARAAEGNEAIRGIIYPPQPQIKASIEAFDSFAGISVAWGFWIIPCPVKHLPLLPKKSLHHLWKALFCNEILLLRWLNSSKNIDISPP